MVDQSYSNHGIMSFSSQYELVQKHLCKIPIKPVSQWKHAMAIFIEQKHLIWTSDINVGNILCVYRLQGSDTTQLWCELPTHLYVSEGIIQEIPNINLSSIISFGLAL